VPCCFSDWSVGGVWAGQVNKTQTLQGLADLDHCVYIAELVKRSNDWEEELSSGTCVFFTAWDQICMGSQYGITKEISVSLQCLVTMVPTT